MKTASPPSKHLILRDSNETSVKMDKKDVDMKGYDASESDLLLDDQNSSKNVDDGIFNSRSKNIDGDESNYDSASGSSSDNVNSNNNSNQGSHVVVVKDKAGNNGDIESKSNTSKEAEKVFESRFFNY